MRRSHRMRTSAMTSEKTAVAITADAVVGPFCGSTIVIRLRSALAEKRKASERAFVLLSNIEWPRIASQSLRAGSTTIHRLRGRADDANMCSPMIVCVLLERFELAVAAGGRSGLLKEPAALAPDPGRELFVGEVSRAAEAFGIHAGMRLGEALSRCPGLALVPPDPMGVAEAWEHALGRLEGLGAAVESLRPGEACFDAGGLQRLHSGRIVRILADGHLAAQGPEQLRRVLAGARIGQGPSRFCAMVAAHGARVRRPGRIAGEDELASRPVALLRRRAETAALVEPLERLGITTLGALAALPRDAVADRFGQTG